MPSVCLLTCKPMLSNYEYLSHLSKLHMVKRLVWFDECLSVVLAPTAKISSAVWCVFGVCIFVVYTDCGSCSCGEPTYFSKSSMCGCSHRYVIYIFRVPHAKWLGWPGKCDGLANRSCALYRFPISWSVFVYVLVHIRFAYDNNQSKSFTLYRKITNVRMNKPKSRQMLFIIRQKKPSRQNNISHHTQCTWKQNKQFDANYEQSPTFHPSKTHESFSIHSRDNLSVLGLPFWQSDNAHIATHRTNAHRTQTISNHHGCVSNVVYVSVDNEDKCVSKYASTLFFWWIAKTQVLQQHMNVMYILNMPYMYIRTFKLIINIHLMMQNKKHKNTAIINNRWDGPGQAPAVTKQSIMNRQLFLTRGQLRRSETWNHMHLRPAFAFHSQETTHSDRRAPEKKKISFLHPNKINYLSRTQCIAFFGSIFSYGTNFAVITHCAFFWFFLFYEKFSFLINFPFICTPLARWCVKRNAFHISGIRWIGFLFFITRKFEFFVGILRVKPDLRQLKEHLWAAGKLKAT